MDFLFLDWLGKPLWLWLSFLAIVAILLVIDLRRVHSDLTRFKVEHGQIQF